MHPRLLASATLFFLLLLFASDVRAQAPLYLVDENTTVREIAFRFSGTPSFEEERLRNQIATKAPGSFHRLRTWFDFVPGIRAKTYPFDPITLQKDVVRLRRFYRQNGFLKPQVDYPISQLDTTSNSIRVIFVIQEGPPLVIQDTRFARGDSTGYAVQQFDGDIRERWIDFRDDTGFRLGERYTEFNRGQIESEVKSWLQDQGFAFARVTSQADVDSTANAVDIRFAVDAGPRARIDRIEVEGNTSVSREIVLRELPLQEGDLFSASKLSQGQRELFGLNLFRVALADLPDQDRDSTVTIRYRVRESKLRTLGGQAGYGAQNGITSEANWTHRNFFGDARTFRSALTLDTGLGAVESFSASDQEDIQQRGFRTSVSLRQPYFFSTRLSATLEPFYEERRIPTLNTQAETDRFLGLNQREFGLNTSFVYEILPFRTVSLQHSFARTRQFVGGATRDALDPDAGQTEDDLFDKSILTLSGTFGQSDDFVNPTRGILIRPSVDIGGRLLNSDVNFRRVRLEVSGYLPLNGTVDLAARVFGGTIRPRGRSLDNLTNPSTPRAAFLAQNRFSDFFFYAGGGTDVRGWRPDQAGSKFLSRTALSDPDSREIYQPLGAQTKFGANLELRLPFPGLGDSWRTAVFVDAAWMRAGNLNLLPPTDLDGTDGAPTLPGGTYVTSARSQMLIGTGGGFRFQTPVGFIRLDLAVKATPDALDLRRPTTVAKELLEGDRETLDAVSKPELRFFGLGTGLPQRLFRLHFGIGRSF